jgi:FtsP/CotA-like multicopper oxidase with cupredoxin domain
MFVVEDLNDEVPDREFALVFHDVPKWATIEAAMRGVSASPMSDPPGSGHGMQIMNSAMGDEVAYATHCINGATYPYGKKLAVRLGDRVRLRLLNASPTQTRYVRLAGHELVVTHADGNPLAQAATVDALRIGGGERYDALFEVRKTGAFALQGISNVPLSSQQAVILHTEGMENAPPQMEPQTLDGLRVFSYEVAGGVGAQTESPPTGVQPTYDLALAGGGWGSSRWTIEGKVWPHTPKLRVRRGEVVTVRIRNTSDMDHPMHLHGHIFMLTEVNGMPLQRPLAKDGSLVSANGSATWRFTADSSPGRWLLHCHNEIHMNDGMMTEVVYVA